jgi:glucose/arabinose dehydrogenase
LQTIENVNLIQPQSLISSEQNIDTSHLGISENSRIAAVGESLDYRNSASTSLLPLPISELSSEHFLFPHHQNPMSEVRESLTTDLDQLTGMSNTEPLSGDLNHDWSNEHPLSREANASSIVFIDPSVADYQNLVNGVEASEVIVLDSTRDGIQQITEVLTQYSHLSDIHIVSHGQAANVLLGTAELNEKTTNAYADALHDWSKALTAEADILFYGCNIGGGRTGAAFVQKLSQITGADIGASNDLTGNTALGGNWELEVSEGKITSPLAFKSQTIDTYNGIFNPVVNFSNFSSITGLKLNGNAAQASNVLRLTSAQTNRAGSAFFNTPFTIDGNTSFQTRFQFRLHGGNGVSGADGFTFMLQNSNAGANAIGESGSSLGYDDNEPAAGIPIGKSLAVEFDTYKSSWDSNNNHVSLLRDGNVTVALKQGNPSTDLNNGNAQNAWVDYDGSTNQLKVFVSGTTTKPTTALFTHTIDLAAVVGSNAFVGFSGGTGARFNNQDIQNWEFTAFPAGTDTTSPSATASAANVTTAGSSNYTFSVTYSDNAAVNVSTLDNSDLLVTGPNGFSQAATLVSVDNSSNGSPRRATYRINTPGGSWDEADNGTYAIALRANQVSDTSNNFISANPNLGSFQVNLDTIAPTVTNLVANNITAGEGNIYTFSVTYSDNRAVNVATLDDRDIRIIGPNGFNQLATLIALDSNSNGSPRTATYRINAPGGSWDTADIGTYTIALETGQVSDTSNNSISSGNLRNFQVTADTAVPTANLSAANIITGGESAYTFTVTYNDNVAIKTATLDNNDVRVIGPNGFSQIATLVSIDSSSNGSPRTATYRLDAPGGTWNATDNGNYTVQLLTNQVSDVSDNFVAAIALGGFEVNVAFNSGIIALSTNPVVIDESRETATITVIRANGSDGSASIDYTTVDNSAAAGDDYQAISGTLTFAEGQTSQTIQVSIANDALSEGIETFNVSLNNVVNATLGTKRTALVTVVDNDNPELTLAFYEPTITVNEGDGRAFMTVILNGNASAGTVAVDYATSNGTATAGSDYTTTSGTLSFTSGEILKTIPIPIVDNISSSPEANKSFSVTLSNSIGAILNGQNPAIITIADDDTFVREVVVSGLTSPTAFDWTPDGSRIYIAQKNGVVRVFDNGTLLSTPFIDISRQVNNVRDRGLLGLAVHPDFQNNPYIYLLFTYDPPEVYNSANVSNPNTLAGPDESGNRPSRLIRVTADRSTNYTTAIPGSEVVLLGKNSTWANTSRPDLDSTGDNSIPPSGITADGTSIPDYLASDSQSHSVGMVKFGIDGSLFVGNGDGTSYGRVDPRTVRVQSLDNLSGKILRLDPITGEGYTDNPFYDGNSNSNRSKVYSYGLRNPFRFTINRSNNEPVIGDVGWNTWEEINTGRGRNFGWPYYEGGLDSNGNSINIRQSGYSSLPEAQAFYTSGQTATAPIFARQHTSGVSAIVMGDFYTGTTFPSLYQGALFFTDVNGGTVDAAIFNSSGRVSSVQRFATGLAGIVQITTGQDSNLYYVNLGRGEIGRWRYTS